MEISEGKRFKIRSCLEKAMVGTYVPLSVMYDVVKHLRQRATRPLLEIHF